MGGGGPSTVKQTSTSEPPKYMQPYAEAALGGAATLASQPYSPYPGATVAPLSPEQQAAIYMQTQRALQGSPVIRAAQNTITNTLQNQGMNAGLKLAGDTTGETIAARVNPLGTNALLGLENPYLQQAIDYATGDVTKAYMDTTLPQLGYGYRQSGSYGNSGNQQLQLQAENQLQRNLGALTSGMRMEDYGLQAQLGESDITRRAAAFEAQKQAELGAFDSRRNAQLMAWDAERNRKMQAAQIAQSLGMADYADAEKLAAAGDARRQWQQQLLDQSANAWSAAQEWPYTQYDWFANQLRGAGFGTYGQSVSTAPNPYAGNSLAGILGGGMALAGLGSELGWI